MNVVSTNHNGTPICHLTASIPHFSPHDIDSMVLETSATSQLLHGANTQKRVQHKLEMLYSEVAFKNVMYFLLLLSLVILPPNLFRFRVKYEKAYSLGLHTCTTLRPMASQQHGSARCHILFRYCGFHALIRNSLPRCRGTSFILLPLDHECVFTL
jgi:hypothetical protein